MYHNKLHKLTKLT